MAGAGVPASLRRHARPTTACARPSSTSPRSTGPRPPPASGRRRSGSPTQLGELGAGRARGATSARSAATGSRRGSAALTAAARSRPALRGAAAGAAALVGGARRRPRSSTTSAAAPQVLRRLLPQRDDVQRRGEAGDPRAERTLVLVAHHDAAHGGLIFDARSSCSLVAARVPGAGRAGRRPRRRSCGRRRRPGAGRARRADRRAARCGAAGRVSAALSAPRFADIATARRRPRRQRQPPGGRGPARLARGLASGAAGRPARPARLDRLGGVLHGGHARRSSAATAPSSTPARTRSSCSTRSARRS